jgi:FKBP-type peptidyl-prolyl cis-trans isomerase SlyD
MKIENQKAVQFHYTLRDESEGAVELESSKSGDPVAYLHGANNIIEGLEEAMLGKVAGDTFSVSIAPEKAYGLRDENRQQRIPLKHLIVRKNAQLVPGMVVHVQTEHGARQATVIKAGKFNVDVDTNHPLAGKQLGFDIEIVDVRDASEEELAHGHVHGVGGHHH